MCVHSAARRAGSAKTSEIAAIGGSTPLGRAVMRSSIDPCALAARGVAEPAGQRIEDPAGDGLARFGQRHQHAERRLAGGEIVGAVERIDDPAQRIAKPLEQRGIGMRRFLADQGGLGQQARQGFGEDLLRCRDRRR